MKLNCDLGESFGAWSLGLDDQVMPCIDQANIACGFHAGDPLVIQKTLQLAKTHGVEVGVHPAYPDLVGFGRRPLQVSTEELTALLHYQIAALEGMAGVQGLTLSYVKPHGALYHEMMLNPEVRCTLMAALASYPRSLALMMQSTNAAAQHRQEAAQHGIAVLFEVFADRRYDDNGTLRSRRLPGALLTRQEMLNQVKQLVTDQSVTTTSGHILPLNADTLCVHGDNPEGVAAIREIRNLIGYAKASG